MPRTNKKSKNKRIVPLIPPHSPAARDERPRIIRWDQPPEPSNTGHFVTLADILLGGRKKSS
jgi:hypothetical protein